MQSLWSRTLRATKCTCRCQQCLSYSTAVARRSTTAFRKRLSAIPSSTIFYSAIFACAAVADGRSKQQRRQKWNNAIQGAKNGLGPHDADPPTSDGREGEPTEEQPDLQEPESDPDFLGSEYMDAVDIAELLKKAVDHVEDPQAAEAIMREKLEELENAARQGSKKTGRRGPGSEEDYATFGEVDDWADARTHTMMDSGQPEWPENTGPSFDPDHFPPQSVYATDERKMEGLGYRWTRRKIQTMNLSMAKLVLAMTDEAQLDRYPLRRKWDNVPECWLPHNVYFIAMKKPAQKKKYFLSIEDFLQRTKMPKRDEDVVEYKPIFGKYPYYEQDHDGQFHYKCHSMNERIFDTFEQCFRGEVTVPSLIATICEELLVSSAPPNITTYNALLLGFNKLKQRNLSRLVIESLHEVHMRPDEITCAAALTHHTATNDAHGFTRFMQLMTGMSTTSYALMLARPTLSLHHASSLQKMQNRVVAHPRSPGRLIQKVHPTPRVMNAVVAGLLRFYGLERAVDVCATLAADGWGFETAALTRFLHACAERRDWPAGVAVWQQLQELRARRRAHQDRPLDRSAYLHMLGLCWRCDRPDVFEQVLVEADRCGGYRKGPLEKDLEKMRRRGLGVFDAADERRADWELRAEMVAKIRQEGVLVGRLREELAAARAARAARTARGAGAARAAWSAAGGSNAASSPSSSSSSPPSSPSPPPPPPSLDDPAPSFPFSVTPSSPNDPSSSSAFPPPNAAAITTTPADTVVVTDNEVVIPKIVHGFAARPEGEVAWRSLKKSGDEGKGTKDG
ncbi:pentatricopeptide repeat domain-containing protein [Diplodia corticola]|uniref:Pentatricopeptide repeat domain-containing protein n=1 Tax=Diplodia corticola TaxID=236234 RepID=A0A1J9RDI3_9PEZI|nr:pentatricopeptide repeat domain-containing protein [Diplodia corticola]OJD38600.1 pentatricopeptide repeat domain-containing protein [Diplodia corticola]